MQYKIDNEATNRYANKGNFFDATIILKTHQLVMQNSVPLLTPDSTQLLTQDWGSLFDQFPSSLFASNQGQLLLENQVQLFRRNLTGLPVLYRYPKLGCKNKCTFKSNCDSHNSPETTPKTFDGGERPMSKGPAGTEGSG